MRRTVLFAGLFLSLSAQAYAQTAPAAPEGVTASRAEFRELVEAARETAKATRENVDYNRVVPDVLFQILAKLDKLENKLDKIENILRANPTAAKKR